MNEENFDLPEEVKKHIKQVEVEVYLSEKTGIPPQVGEDRINRLKFYNENNLESPPIDIEEDQRIAKAARRAVNPSNN